MYAMHVEKLANVRNLGSSSQRLRLFPRRHYPGIDCSVSNQPWVRAIRKSIYMADVVAAHRFEIAVYVLSNAYGKILYFFCERNAQGLSSL